MTAAIVGIAMAVIVLISGGINNASTGINDTLNSAGSGWPFLDSGSTTFADFLADYISGGGDTDIDAFADMAMTAIINDAAPSGYSNYGDVDTETGTPVYYSDFAVDENGVQVERTVSINGEILAQSDYTGETQWQPDIIFDEYAT